VGISEVEGVREHARPERPTADDGASTPASKVRSPGTPLAARVRPP